MRRSRTWKLRITILFMRLLVAVCEISIYKSVHQYVAERSNLTKVPQGLVVSLACRIFGITVQAFVVSTLGALLKNNLGRERLRDHVRQIVQSVETVREFAVPLYIILMRGRFPGGYDPFWPQTGYVEETHVPGGGYIELAWYLTVSLAVLALHRWTFLRTTCSGPDSFTASFLQLACVTVFTAAFPPASVIAYVMTSLELRARERSTCSSESVPCDLDQWCDKFSSLCRAVVFINTLVVAFSSEIVPMWFFAHRTGSLEGYTDFKMQSVTSVADSVSTNTTTCFVHAYADLAKRHKKFNDSHHVLLFRMGFAIVFQNVVLIVTTFISQHA